MKTVIQHINEAAKPKLSLNKSLSSKTDKVYNAVINGDQNVIFTPVIQRSSNRLTYFWRLTYEPHHKDKGPFDSPKEALKDAVKTLDKLK